MNDLYNETITRNGKTYYYDPDHDCYSSRSTDEGPIGRHAWIAVVLFLAIVCYYIEFARYVG